MNTVEGKVAEVTRTLAVFQRPGQVTELRALDVNGHRAECSFHSDPVSLAKRAAWLDSRGAKGVYFTPNPLRPDLPLERVQFQGARKADVLARHWLLIDSDPVRRGEDGQPLGDQAVPATEAERLASWNVLDLCRGTLDAAGLTGAVVGDSGNGWHLCYPVELPNDDAAQALVKALLVGLQARCGDTSACVDGKPSDAPRIWKLYGTTARKGQESTGRPHRVSWLAEGQPPAPGVPEANTAMLGRLLALWRAIEEDGRRAPQPPLPAHDVVMERARLYLESCPPAVSGQDGHGTTLSVARAVVWGFDLGAEAGFALLSAHYNPRCRPPWSESELRHKCQDADAPPFDKPRGYLLNAPPPNGAPGYSIPDSLPYIRENGKTESKESRAGAQPEPFVRPIPASELKAGPAQAWLLHGLIARGEVTLLSALWKSGKTTFLAQMVRHMESGGQFCGQQIVPAQVLYVTEEGESRWAKRRDSYAIRDNVHFLVRPFRGKPRWDRWAEFLAYLVVLQKERHRDLIVFDTISDLWPVRDENDAAQVQAALMPLHAITDQGHAALTLVHHNRKGDGIEATASRGSGALTAFVDTIVEFRRFDPVRAADRRRVITAYGRDDETPDELVVELTELDGYVACGRRQEVNTQELAPVIRTLLPQEPRGLTVEEIRAKWPGQIKPALKRVTETLRAGAEAGLWHREGDGVRGDPFRYWLASGGRASTS